MNRFNYKIFIFCSFLLIFCWGCATGGAKHSSKKESLKDPELDSGKVLRPSLLKQEGMMTLIVVPFTAGIGVEANQDLDLVSLWIVKGIISTVNRYGAHFKILPAEEADKADLIIQGHITRREKTQTGQKWMFRPQEMILSVEARMTERKTGNLVLIYSRGRKAPVTKEKRANEVILAQQIGFDIAFYILRDVL